MTKRSRTKNKPGRPRTGGKLIWRETKGWCCRITVTVEGERIRRMIELGTRDRVVARRKRVRLLAEETAEGAAATTSALLTVREAADATCKRWEADGIKTAAGRRSGLRRFVLGCPDDCTEDHEHTAVEPHHIGERVVTSVGKAEVEAIYDAMREAGKSRQTVVHIRNFVSAVFDDLWRDGLVPENPVKRARLPKLKRDRRHRAVLTEGELASYLRWQHPKRHHQLAVEQRQTMAVMSWCFGGLRAGELHAMRWEDFSDDFATGTVRRGKTEKLQSIQVPDIVRAYLDRWHQRWKKPRNGLVFPCLRGPGAGEHSKTGVSHASALRRDLQRAQVAAKGSRRMRELFETTKTTKPVDFHSFRRAAAGALKRAGVNEQTAMALLQHADSKTHRRYWSQADGAQEVPLDALPQLPAPRVWAQAVPKPDPPPNAPVPLPVRDNATFSARPGGLEPPTIGLEGRRSIRLSYGRMTWVWRTVVAPAAASSCLADSSGGSLALKAGGLGRRHLAGEPIGIAVVSGEVLLEEGDGVGVDDGVGLRFGDVVIAAAVVEGLHAQTDLLDQRAHVREGEMPRVFDAQQIAWLGQQGVGGCGLFVIGRGLVCGAGLDHRGHGDGAQAAGLEDQGPARSLRQRGDEALVTGRSGHRRFARPAFAEHVIGLGLASSVSGLQIYAGPSDAKGREAAEGVSSDADAFWIGAEGEQIGGPIGAACEQRVEASGYVAGAQARGLQIGQRRGAVDLLGEGVADVIGRRHHEAVAGEIFGQINAL